MFNDLANDIGIPHVSALTADELDEKARCEASFHEFAKVFWDVLKPFEEFVDNFHIAVVADHLQATFEEVLQHLMINVPPGHMKSLLSSVLFPAWVWIHAPHYGFLCASFSQNNSTRDSVACRNIIQSEKYQRYWGDKFKLVGDQNEKTRFDNNAGGWRIAMTTRSLVGTGEHPKFLIVDDPHDPEKVETSADIDHVIDGWWRGKMQTRGLGIGVHQILVGQRTAFNDLFGYVCTQNGGDQLKIKDLYSDWDQLRLPMRAEPHDAIATRLGFIDTREEDELLWPKLFDEKKVRHAEKELGTRAPGQLQQRPVKRGGGLFDVTKFTIVKMAPPVDVIGRARYWDKAATEGGGAYTSGVRMSIARNGLVIVEDVKREQLAFDGRTRLIKHTATSDARSFGHDMPVVHELEGGGGGKDAGLISARDMHGFNFKLDRPQGKGSKETRAEPYAGQVNAGNVVLIEGDWNQAYMDELQQFPKGKYKDQVDASSGCYNLLALRGGDFLEGDLIVSGDDEEDSAPLTREEIDELPDDIRDALIGLTEEYEDMKASRRQRQRERDYDDDDW